MQTTAVLLEAIAKLLWPTLAIAVAATLVKPIIRLMAGIKPSKVTVKVGGQELTLEENESQVQKILSALVKEVADIKTSLAEKGQLPQPVVSLEKSSSQTILWVDDTPKNNSYIVQQLDNSKITVDFALSTSEAIDHLSSQSYTLVISDIGRVENSRRNRKAGIDLMRYLKENEINTPIIFFTSPQGVAAYRDLLLSDGALGVTTSYITLMQLIQQAGIELSYA